MLLGLPKENPVILTAQELKLIDVEVKASHYNKAVVGDAASAPIVIAIRSNYLKRGDVIMTTKRFLFYSKPFNREDFDMVLGKYRIGVVELTDEVKKNLKDFEEGGKICVFKTKVLIPKVLLIN